MDRTVHIPRERLTPWLAGFTERHGAPRAARSDDGVRLEAPDGARADLVPPFGPLPGAGRGDGGADDPVAALVEHCSRDRRVAALLVRRGGHAAGLFDGARLLASKVGSGYVQGRTKAGGWSQQRYARRRDNQATKVFHAAADAAAQVLLPRLEEVEHLVLGGDRPACAQVLADPRLVGLGPLADHAPFHPTPDPRQRILEDFPATYLQLTIRLNDLA